MAGDEHTTTIGGPGRIRAGTFPVNVYQSQGRLMLTAPLPGLEPANIHIHVDERVVALKVDLRGPHQKDDARYFQQEWMTGPYSRVIDLPVSVDAIKANATYDNGVLVLVLPIAQASTAGEISMAKIGTAKGQAIGHVGQDFRRSPGVPGRAGTAPPRGG